MLNAAGRSRNDGEMVTGFNNEEFISDLEEKIFKIGV